MTGPPSPLADRVLPTSQMVSVSWARNPILYVSRGFRSLSSSKKLVCPVLKCPMQQGGPVRRATE